MKISVGLSHFEKPKFLKFDQFLNKLFINVIFEKLKNTIIVAELLSVHILTFALVVLDNVSAPPK